MSSHYFTTALKALGFESRQQQLAFADNLIIAGTFEPERLWQDLHQIGHWDSAAQVATIFQCLKDIETAQQFQDFHCKDHLMDAVDMVELLTYWGQSAFGYDPSAAWYKNNRDRLTKNAETLGLMDALEPKRIEYDETLIYGAGRLVTEEVRISELFKLGRIIKDFGLIRLLTGNRKLRSPLDGIASGEENSFTKIALSYHLGKTQEELTEEDFAYAKADDADAYIDYLSVVLKKPKDELTEADMTVEVFARAIDYGTHVSGPIDLIDVQKERGLPTTYDTLVVSANRLVERIQKGDFRSRKDIYVLGISNQPYAPRQHLEAVEVYNEVLAKNGLNDYKVSMETVGSEAKVGPLAAMQETAKNMSVYYNKLENRRPSKFIMYRSRQNFRAMTPIPRRPVLYPEPGL